MVVSESPVSSVTSSESNLSLYPQVEILAFWVCGACVFPSQLYFPMTMQFLFSNQQTFSLIKGKSTFFSLPCSNLLDLIDFCNSLLLIYWRVSSENTIQEKGNNLIRSYPSAPQLRQLFWGIIHHIHGKDWMP